MATADTWTIDKRGVYSEHDVAVNFPNAKAYDTEAAARARLARRTNDLGKLTRMVVQRMDGKWIAIVVWNHERARAAGLGIPHIVEMGFCVTD
jgi:hypothetical protein